MIIVEKKIIEKGKKVKRGLIRTHIGCFGLVETIDITEYNPSKLNFFFNGMLKDTMDSQEFKFKFFSYEIEDEKNEDEIIFKQINGDITIFPKINDEYKIILKPKL